MRNELSVLTDYIRRESAHQGPIDPDVDLLDANILDSFSIVQLAVFIQEEFGVELEPEDFARDNLATLSGMLALIDKRKAVT
jgi:acyl carrier protein